jgi:Bacterial CdiA-CT RNAse A domain
MQWLTASHRYVCIAVALSLGGLVSCQPPASTNDALRVSSSERAGLGTHSAHGAVRDLSRDEAAGGHILRKHVGQTDDELRDRLRREPRITGASTYTDRATADRAVGEAIAQSQDRIERWLTRTGGHPNLVIDYDSPVPIGRTINRGESESHRCAHAIVVLKYLGTNDYCVLTSYPECRS